MHTLRALARTSPRLVSSFGVICVISALCGSTRHANAQATEIKFDANANFLKLPAGMNFGEVTGIAINRTKIGRAHV